MTRPAFPTAAHWPTMQREARWRAAAGLGLGVVWMWSVGTVTGLLTDPGWGWVVLGAVLLFVVVLVGGIRWQQRQRPGSRPSALVAAQAQYAVRHHVDPGQPARQLADRLAARTAQLRWAAAMYLCLGIGQVARLGDQVPVTQGTVVAAVVALLGWVALSGWSWRMGGQARRWLADPPGPAPDATGARAVAPWRGGQAMKVLYAIALICYLIAAGIELAAWLS